VPVDEPLRVYTSSPFNRGRTEAESHRDDGQARYLNGAPSTPVAFARVIPAASPQIIERQAHTCAFDNALIAARFFPCSNASTVRNAAVA
jgi:hypothetical protein